MMWFFTGLTILALATVALARWARIGLGWQPVIALVRATAQLALIATLLSGVLAAPWTVVLFVALMLSTASWTAGGRLVELRHGRRIAATGVLTGAAVALVPVFALQLVALDIRQVIAIAGIVIGNAMAGATLTGRMFHQTAAQRSSEVEGWLALGARPSQAHAEIGQAATRETLLPSLDQTRSTGLVTLPGAFVGALFGGADPITAAQFQLMVLAAIALAKLTTSIVVTRMAGRSPFIVPTTAHGERA
ncbi:MAG: ABC transporter permease [Propioniciclava sp.]